MSSERSALLSSQQKRTNSTTGGVEPSRNGEDGGELDEYEYDEDFHMNKTLKTTLIGGGAFLCLMVLYIFTIYLPNHFIPKAVELEEIVKLDDINVDLVPISINSQFVPTPDVDNKKNKKYEKNKRNKKAQRKSVERIIMIGDIHGHFKEFKALLKKIKFNHKKDHLLVLGDFITKGPDSLKVLEYLISENVDCVLGNHEYNLLQDYAQFHNLRFPEVIDTIDAKGGFNDDPEFLLAKKLQPKHVQYVNKCSMIKRLGDVPMYNKKIGKQIFKGISTETTRTGYAVHAGLRWDLPVLDQIPDEILTMRALLPPFYNETTEDPTVPGAIAWSKYWNKQQKLLPANETSIVYYGHDARKGLNLKNYAKGLDSGCDRGDSLLAMILWAESTAGGKVSYNERVVQVDCDDDNDN